ncbi:MAG TPA: glycosyltransferase family 39 protein, partial [Nitrolancea sp.]|nr:glycosyltransferase family 39 protein [Nitrolancea sp.]
MEATNSAASSSICVKQPAGSRLAGEAASDALITSRAVYLIVLGFVFFFGALVRIGPVLMSSFPLNDGGMFMQAIIDLRHANFRLPDSLNYNGLPIAYAYPPLGFYIAGLTAAATNASLVTILRIIPALFSLLTLGAFMLLAHDILRKRESVVIASLAFALVPRSHNWEIMGGGLTRSIGFFFAIIAIWQAYRLYTQRSRTTLILTALFGALACLSHLEMGMFVAFSAALLFVLYGRNRIGIR